jgi:hypothetical protein
MDGVIVANCLIELESHIERTRIAGELEAIIAAVTDRTRCLDHPQHWDREAAPL